LPSPSSESYSVSGSGTVGAWLLSMHLPSSLAGTMTSILWIGLVVTFGVAMSTITKRSEAMLRPYYFFNIKAKWTLLISKFLKIEAKLTLLKKIKEKQPLLIPDIRKIKKKRTLLIPYNRKIKANQILLIQELKKIAAKQPLLISEIGKT
jgi:hypothetical protein